MLVTPASLDFFLWAAFLLPGSLPGLSVGGCEEEGVDLLTEAPDLPSLGEMGSYLGPGLRRGCQGLGHITSGQGRASLSVGREQVTVGTGRGITDTCPRCTLTPAPPQ